MSDVTEPIKDARLPDHDRRMEAARARAEWELGDGSWAGMIVGAYLYPDQDSEALNAEKES